MKDLEEISMKIVESVLSRSRDGVDLDRFVGLRKEGLFYNYDERHK